MPSRPASSSRTAFDRCGSPLGETPGLLTGYYEPIVDGSRVPNPEFHWPLYRRPRDLVIDGRKPAPGSFPNRASVGRLNADKKMEPYHDRLAIEEGALDGQHLEICWLKDPFEAMSIQIQGSARVRLEDGTLVRINYDAHNGFGYTAVGRILIERNLVPRDEMSMDRIKRWMHANPDQAKEVRGTNRSFVFFRITGLNNEDEPSSAQGVPLNPGRSIAVDRTHVYGTPFFIDADLPIDSARPTTKFRKLMVAQDTGSASSARPAPTPIGRRRRCGSHRGPHPPPGPLRRAAAARARHGRSRQGDAAAAAQARRFGRSRGQEGRRQEGRAKVGRTGQGPEGRRSEDVGEEIATAGCQERAAAATLMTADTPRRRRLTETEHELWRGVTRSVAPLKRKRAAAAKRRRLRRSRRRAGRGRQAEEKAEGRSVRARQRSAGAGVACRPKAPPPLLRIDRRTKQRIARGTVEIDDRLDLHGRTQSEAHGALLRFLHRAQGNGLRTVLVITGKGHVGDGASERGVLKRQVPLWLGLPEFRSYVLGLEDSHVGHGGGGQTGCWWWLSRRRAPLRNGRNQNTPRQWHCRCQYGTVWQPNNAG